MLLNPPGFFYTSGVSGLALVANNRVGNVNSIEVPSGVQAGDLIIHADLADYIDSSGNASIPSGFTLIHRANTIWDSHPATGTIYGKVAISYKIANGTESGTNITGQSGGFRKEKYILIYRANVSVVSVTPTSWSTVSGSTSSATNRTISINDAHAPLLVLAFYARMEPFSQGNPNFTPTQDVMLAGLDGRSQIRTKSFPTEESVSNVSMSFPVTGEIKSLASGYLRVAGAA